MSEPTIGDLLNQYFDQGRTGKHDEAAQRIRLAIAAELQKIRAEADDETYEIGKRDGYSEAVQQIDLLTGGDGEYRYCTDHDPDRHTPGPAEMIQRIVDRFEVLNLLDDATKTGRDEPDDGTAPKDNVPCPCTLIEQDEDCPVGFPSMLCGICKGTGSTTPEQVSALACEMIKIASDMGEPEDPFAAWETIDLIKSQHGQLRRALVDMLPPDLPWKRDADGVLIHHKVAAINAARAILSATTEGSDR